MVALQRLAGCLEAQRAENSFYDGRLAKLAHAEPQRDAMLAAIAANTK